MIAVISRKSTLALVAALAFLPAVVMAHHSYSAEYDGTRIVTLRGTITRVLWAAPHGHMWVEVKNTEGKTVTWELETGAPAQLLRQGWTKEDFPFGREVIVKGYLAKDGTPTVNATTVKLVESGKELGVGSPETPAAPGGR